MTPSFKVQLRQDTEVIALIAQHDERSAALLPLLDLDCPVQQFAKIQVELTWNDRVAIAEAEVLQIIPGVGIVARFGDIAPLRQLLRDEEPLPIEEIPAVDETPPVENTPEQEEPPSDLEPNETADHEGHRPTARGMGPTSWPIEKLRIEWSTLSLSDQVRVARYGGNQARAFIIKSGDKTMHPHLVANSRISVGEIAMLAGTAGVEVKILDHIMANREWLRNTQVARNLVCNPKMPLPKVVKVIDHLPTDELTRLTRTGQVRAAVKREIMRKLDWRQKRGS